MKNDLEAIVIDQAAQIVKLNDKIRELVKDVKKMERLASRYKFDAINARSEMEILQKESFLPRGLK